MIDRPTYAVGDKVRFNDAYWLIAETKGAWVSQSREYTVSHVFDVGQTQQAGVGHHQWLDLEEDPRPRSFMSPVWSGAFFEPVKAKVNVMDIEELILDMDCPVSMCGSKVTCNPPPMGTDTDYLVEVPQSEAAVSRVVDALGSAGFMWESGEHYQNAARDGFMSWRKDDVNFIVSSNPEFLMRHKAATALSKRLNLLQKADRVALFQAVLYGNIVQ